MRGSNPRVLSLGRYYLGLIDLLGERGLCSFYSDGIVKVKKTNAFDESFTLLASTGYVRRGPQAYSVTCVPASFPVGDNTPPPSVPGCALGGSRSLACGIETPQYLGVLQDVIKQVTQEHPEFFDFGDIQSGSGDGYKVLNPDGYVKAVADVFTSRGFCSIGTSDMQVKRDNILSEGYHILTGTLHIRHDLGSYEGTCYPAAF